MFWEQRLATIGRGNWAEIQDLGAAVGHDVAEELDLAGWRLSVRAGEAHLEESPGEARLEESPDVAGGDPGETRLEEIPARRDWRRAWRRWRISPARRGWRRSPARRGRRRARRLEISAAIVVRCFDICFQISV
ncbi:unnamed protein product [Alopecurus aequalis]